MHLFGYLKKHPNCHIVLNSAPLECDDAVLMSSFDPDFLKNYPDAKDEIDPSLPTPYGSELQTSIFKKKTQLLKCYLSMSLGVLRRPTLVMVVVVVSSYGVVMALNFTEMLILAKITLSLCYQKLMNDSLTVILFHLFFFHKSC